jgi:hypothetical protein
MTMHPVEAVEAPEPVPSACEVERDVESLLRLEVNALMQQMDVERLEHLLWEAVYLLREALNSV